MVNWASLFAILTPIAAALSAVGAARDAKAGLVAVLIAALGGVIVGLGGAMLAVGLATAVLRRTSRQVGWFVSTGYSVAYFFAPLIVTGITCVATALLVRSLL
jgi:hypothetical protein